ncbi:MAG: response regulator [Gemmatimonadota bacterium]|nr:response regulator [Gemmatimonadota bacterium]
MTKILLVEDDEMNRDMLSRRLLKRDYEVVIAVDGEEGVALAGSENPDIILMDMSLPGIDGWTATRRVKADEATSGIPVIALTAHAMAGDREKALEAGCDDFDTKPVELQRLLGKIEALLSRGSAEG